MIGVRRVVELIRRFTRAVKRLTNAGANTLPRSSTPAECQGISADAAATNSKAPRASLTQKELLLYLSSFKSDFTETNAVTLAHVPPAKGLLNLVEILSAKTDLSVCKDISQSDQV